MAVDGKNASGRLAAATVFWLLVAIFANQDYVYCEGEEQQLQQQQQQQQQFQPPRQQQLQPSQLPPQVQPSQVPLSQPQLPQPLGMPGLMNMVNDVQPNTNRLTEQSMNPDFGTLPITQQQLNNVRGSSNVPSGGQIPMFPSGLPQVPNFDETNLSQGINPSSLLTNPPPDQGQTRPPPQMNNAQGPMNNLQQRYPEQNKQQKPMVSVPSQIYPSNNNYFSERPPMGQQILKPYQSQYYFNGNADNMYEVPVSTNLPADYPGQSHSNTNFGDLMRPTHIITNMMPENPLDLLQKPVGMIINSVDKLGKYGEGLKDGFNTAFREVVGKIFDQGESGARKVFDMGLSGTNAAIDFGRRLLIPESRNQQMGVSGGRYNSPQLSMQPSYGFNPNHQSPQIQMGYAMQPQAPGAGQFMGGNSNSQPPSQGTIPQNLYPQQRLGPNYSTNNPINAPQPIIRYGQD